MMTIRDNKVIRAVIFDMDGLLIDSEPFWQKAEKEIFRELGIDLTEEMMVATMGLRTDELIRYWYHYHPWEKPGLREIADRFTRTMIDFFVREGKLMEGVHHALEFFSDRGLPLALASSSDMELIRAFLDKFGLEKMFSIVYSAEFEKYGKPHPAVYMETAKRMAVEPVNCLAIEDSFHGMIAAKAARMKVIVIPETKDRMNPRFGAADIRLGSLNDIDDEIFGKLNIL
ncbi:MAG: hexitol phosphatase HxpB [Bacteroidota bacterium]